MSWNMACRIRDSMSYSVCTNADFLLAVTTWLVMPDLLFVVILHEDPDNRWECTGPLVLWILVRSTLLSDHLLGKRIYSLIKNSWNKGHAKIYSTSRFDLGSNGLCNNLMLTCCFNIINWFMIWISYTYHLVSTSNHRSLLCKYSLAQNTAIQEHLAI